MAATQFWKEADTCSLMEQTWGNEPEPKGSPETDSYFRNQRCQVLKVRADIRTTWKNQNSYIQCDENLVCAVNKWAVIPGPWPFSSLTEDCRFILEMLDQQSLGWWAWSMDEGDEGGLLCWRRGEPEAGNWRIQRKRAAWEKRLRGEERVVKTLTALIFHSSRSYLKLMHLQKHII